ncbi:large ribosomal subunit protein uL18m isoform X2 [Panulirus ornatus]|uniref:large ribosomal subunit protein uL18m isoform X2 n=1 Tax=Panulirus ornatus TaxID=150431 RepID=UPI003A84AF4C
MTQEWLIFSVPPSHILSHLCVCSIKSIGLSLSRSTHGVMCGENDKVNPDFINRNPRSMEMLRLARKPQGWDLEASPPKNWYKLHLEQSNRHIKGWVEHHTGITVVSASTHEWSIKQHLYSTTSVNAAENIGRILAQRCLESGICEISTDLEKYKDSSEKVRAFLSSIEEGGIHPKEAFTINERLMQRWFLSAPVLPWHVSEEQVLKDDQQNNAD